MPPNDSQIPGPTEEIIEISHPVAVVHPTRQPVGDTTRQPVGDTTRQPVGGASSAASSETSEELDSLEEGRAPLLRRQQHQQDLLGEDDLNNYDGDDDHAGRRVAAAPGESPKRRRIPRERHKAFIALLMLIMASASNVLVLSYIHELIPETAPLPDFAFRSIPYWPWALSISEYLMVTSCAAMITIAVLHRHRWVVLRRIATVAALLYLGRSVTMFVTQVPVADPNYYCSPKLKPDERTFWNIFKRAMSVLLGLGLSINHRHTLCGDYIYSGHTIVHVTCYLFIREYSPLRWKLLHYLSLCFATVGVCCLLVSRGHYSIDVIVAYWITTRVFWQYHTWAAIPILRSNLEDRNHMIKECWYPIFRFMEANVHRPVPRKYNLPFPLRRFLPARFFASLRTPTTVDGSTHVLIE